MTSEHDKDVIFYKGEPLDYIEMPIKIGNKLYSINQMYFLSNGNSDGLAEYLQSCAENADDIQTNIYDAEFRLTHNVIAIRRLREVTNRPIEIEYKLDDQPKPLTVVAFPNGLTILKMQYDDNGPVIAEWVYRRNGALYSVLNGQDKTPKDLIESIDYEEEMVEIYKSKHPNATEDEIEAYCLKLLSNWRRLHNVPQSVAEILLDTIKSRAQIKFYESQDHEGKQQPTSTSAFRVDKEYDFFGEKFFMYLDGQFGVFVCIREDGNRKVLRFPLVIERTINSEARDPITNTWANIPFAEQFKVTITEP